MNFLRVFAVCEKEAKEIIRDPATVLIALLMPLVMLFLFGYAVSLDVDNVSIGVVDQDIVKGIDAESLVDRRKDPKTAEKQGQPIDRAGHPLSNGLFW